MAHESCRLEVHAAAALSAALERSHEACKLLAVAGDAQQLADSLVVEIERAALKAAGDYTFPDDRISAGTLPQHFGVVDLAQFNVAAAHRCPHPGDAAVDAH